MTSIWKMATHTKQFSLHYHARNLLTPTARQLTTENNPIRPKILHMYQNRDPNTLWWRVAYQNLPLKRVVRSYCARRTRKAFREALRSRGFDEQGRRIVKQSNGPPVTEIGLTGSADIVVRATSYKEPYSAVRKEIELLVNKLVQIAERKPSTLLESRRLNTEEKSP